MISVERYHDISCGHRVVGHESKCAHLHGHNYRVTFYCRAEKLDKVGRVIDFSVIKSRLCVYLEMNLDHKFLVWCEDPMREELIVLDKKFTPFPYSVRLMPFNPTAENLADWFLRTIGPLQLEGTGVTLYKCTVLETRKCAATSEL